MRDMYRSLRNIETFNRGPKLQQVIIQFFVKHLAKREEIDKLTQQFKFLDVDSDGIIMQEEFQRIVMAIELNVHLLEEKD